MTRAATAASFQVNSAPRSTSMSPFLEEAVQAQEYVRRLLRARYRLGDVHSDDPQIEPEADVGPESPEPGEAPARVPQRPTRLPDQPAASGIDESNPRWLHRESDSSQANRPRVQEIQEGPMQLVPVLELRQSHPLTLRWISR